MQKPISIQLDTITKRTVTDYSNIRKGDTLLLSVAFYQNSVILNVAGQAIKLILRKSDGYSIEKTVIGTGSISTIELDEQATLALGIVKGEIHLTDAEGTSISNWFTYEVRESLADDIITKSTDDIETLEAMQKIIIKYAELSEAISGTLDPINSLNEIKEYIDNNLPSLKSENDSAEANISNETNANNEATKNIADLIKINNTSSALKAGLETDISAGDVLKTTLEEDIAAGTVLKNTLENDVSAGALLKNDLEADISAGNTLKSALEISETSADALKKTLDTSKSNADASKTALDLSKSSADNSKTALDKSIDLANSSKTALDISKTAADNSKIALDLSKTNADSSKTALDLSKTAADNSKTAIDNSTNNANSAKTNLDKSIDKANAFASTYSDIANATVNIVNLNYVKDATAEMIRDTTPSGFTQLSDLDYTYMSTNPNTIKLSSDSIAYVNGYKVKIPAGTVITLDAPPTSGTRDDLVFLECWKQTDASGAITWNSRIRVVSGVDFNTFSEGLHTYDRTSNSYNQKVLVQGANSTPLAVTVASGNHSLYGFHNIGLSEYYNTSVVTNIKDTGLYMAGIGDSASKTTLNTTDGYVYAIPMFRVHRRNSGGYSVSNGNGSLNYLSPAFSARNGTFSSDCIGTGVWTLTNSNDYNAINVEDIFVSDNGNKMKIISKNGSNNVTVTFIYVTSTFTVNTALSAGAYTRVPRIDKLNANIIYERDIIDLRHQVSLTGFNYQQMLEENFDKLLRGELQTNAKTAMIKHYHGVPKTPIDANHIFYASLDGSIIPEVGSAGTLIKANTGYKSMPTGLGTTDGYKYTVDLSNSNVYTIDMWGFGSPQFSLFGGGARLLSTWGGIGVLAYSSSTTYTAIAYKPVTFNHLRIVIDKTNSVLKIYYNGKLVSTLALNSYFISSLTAGCLLAINASVNMDGSYITTNHTTVADLSISNIDRGSTFATLPQDFIDGYARIAPAFNEQRNVYSDALTSETDIVQVKAIGVNSKTITTTQATSGVWTNADKVKVKGLGQEIIASDATPTVKYLNGSTLTDVVGTWSNLGTNEATLTLGTNVSLINQDLIITYSLNEVAGQGGISEVLTTTLAGESNGKKLTVNPTVHISDDFAGKVSGDTVVNPNIFRPNYLYGTLKPPTIYGETTDYSNLSTLNVFSRRNTILTNGNIPIHCFSFNLIRIVEDKFGTLPCPNDIASKVAWLKANISSIKCNWWGYGSCPSGNKATLARWENSGASWITGGTNSSTSPILTTVIPGTIIDAIDKDGFFHALAYTDASDGVTASTIYTDYVNIEIVLNTPANYDVLAPENPRRDDGKGNILLVQKETKTIKTMFPRSNADGVVTYGDYLPYQGLAPTISATDTTLKMLANNKNFISDVGTGGYKRALTTVKENQLPAGINRSYYMNSNNIGYFKLEDFKNFITPNNDLENPFVKILRNLNFSAGYLEIYLMLTLLKN